MVSYSNGWVYFYDKGGDYLKASLNTSSPVPVDTNTTSINSSVNTLVLGAQPDFKHNQSSITIKNQSGLDVSDECTVSGYSTSLIYTGFTHSVSQGDQFIIYANSGLYSGVTNTTTIQFTHVDGPIVSIPVTVWPLDNYPITTLKLYINTIGITGVSWASGQTNTAQTYIYDQNNVLLNDYGFVGDNGNTGVTSTSTGFITQQVDGNIGTYPIIAALGIAGQSYYYDPASITAEADFNII